MKRVVVAGHVASSRHRFQLDEHLPPADTRLAHEFRTFRHLIAAMKTQGIGTDIVIFSGLRMRTPSRVFEETLRDIVSINTAMATVLALVERRMSSYQGETFNLYGRTIASTHPHAACEAQISSRCPRARPIAGKKYALSAACVGGNQGGGVVPQVFA